MIAPALDPELATLRRKDVQGEELPFALKRFRSHMGDNSVIGAMQRATSEVLDLYASSWDITKPRISASRLCEVCGLVLQGEPRCREKAQPVYSALHVRERHNGHTGELRLDPQRPTIQLPPGIDLVRARVAVGHEIGHYLIHRRGAEIDSLTARLPSTAEEEALSEYAARLLLLPAPYRTCEADKPNLIYECLQLASRSEVTLHSAAARLGDPDSPFAGGVKGVILWRLNTAVPVGESVPSRLTPQWHLCPDAFIPIKRCHAGRQSLVAELGSANEGTVEGSRVEPVSIGSFKGTYRVDAVAWGSVRRGTRLVLAAFILP